MRITVDIPDEVAARIEAEGFGLESYLRDLIHTDLSEKQITANDRRNAVDAMRQFAAINGFTAVSSSPKSLVHEGHKY